LYLATLCGHEEILRILLAREDVDRNLAVGPGKTRIVKMLLERADVRHNPVEGNGWTPLYRARAQGPKEVVALIESR
ncbi:hypothetical protein L873DRAFT_1649729, partial [Choiromyces venosus 120613-1]